MRILYIVGIWICMSIGVIHAACVTDPKQAALDIIVVVDTSANMGPTRVQQIATLAESILSKFTISADKNYTVSNPTSRVAIVSYEYNGTVVANISSLNTNQDVQTALNSLQGSTTNFNADYASAIDIMFLYNTILDPSNVRTPVFLVFSSAIATQNVLDGKYMKYTMITVNYNLGSNNVKSFLTQIATPGLAFRSHSKTLAQDILSGILSATC